MPLQGGAMPVSRRALKVSLSWTPRRYWFVHVSLVMLCSSAACHREEWRKTTWQGHYAAEKRVLRCACTPVSSCNTLSQ